MSSPRAGAAGRARQALGSGALLVGGVVVTLVAGELLVRGAGLGPEFRVLFRERFRPSENPVLEYELEPGAADGAGRINRGGFRDREFAETKPDGVFRIAALGDSVTYGSGEPAQRSWPKQLEALFPAASSSPRIEVLNFGVEGYNVAQIAEQVRVRVLAYEPDLLLYGYVLNDPQAYSFEAAGLRNLASPDRTGAARLLARSRLFLMAHHWLSEARPPGDPGTRPIAPDPAYLAIARDPRGGYFRALHADPVARARLAAGLDALAAATAEPRVPVGVAIFPLFLEEPAPYPLADVHRQVAASAAERGFLALDLAPALIAAPGGAGPDLQLDFLHPNAAGFARVAAAIRSWICAEGLVPAAACAAPAPERRG